MQNQWLPYAKRLAVGMKDRIYHGQENRPNLIIGNEPDRWWAYCQRCKTGAVESKTHASLGSAPVVPRILRVPTDLVDGFRGDALHVVGPFCAAKNVLPPVLPRVWYSDSAKRMLLQDDTGKWHGRDITGHSTRKWLNYNGAQFVGAAAGTVVVTEDLFSMYKVRWALRSYPRIRVCCSLGAWIADAGVLALRSAQHVVWFYDGDQAGYSGAESAMKRMRPFGVKQSSVFPPSGKDPKDLDAETIRVILKEFL